MSFIRAKEIPPGSGNWYDYEVMTIHEGSKVRQKVIRYIGKSSLRASSSAPVSLLSLSGTAPVIDSPVPTAPDKPARIAKRISPRSRTL